VALDKQKAFLFKQIKIITMALTRFKRTKTPKLAKLIYNTVKEMN